MEAAPVDHPAAEFAPTGTSAYAHKRIGRRDNWATILYSILCLGVAIGSIPCFIRTDPDADLYTGYFYQNSTTCNPRDFQSAYSAFTVARNTTVEDDMEYNAFVHYFKGSLATWLPITAVWGIISGACYILLFRRWAEGMVLVSLIGILGLSGGLAIVLLAAGAVPPGVILLVFTVVMGIMFWILRADLKMCARLLSVAGRGLQECAGLIPVAIGLKFVGLAIMGYIFAALVAAGNIGHAGRSGSAAVIVPSDSSPLVGSCYDFYGRSTSCCQFYTDTSANVYILLGAIVLAWTSQLILQLKLYVVADTVAQWYWQPAGAFTNEAGPSVRVAFRHAMTNGFGTAAFAAAILVVLRMIRDAMQRASRKNIICCIINCIAQPLLAMLEKFTRFATIAAAITGQTFVTAATEIFGVLKRNFLATYSLWWIPDMVVGAIVFLGSLLWAGFVYLLTALVIRSKVDSSVEISVCFSIAAICFLLMMFVLAFVANLLMDIVNSCYICWSLDRDQQKVTRPEIAAIYEQVPTLKGAVIEQPGGEVNYGRPDATGYTAAATMPPPPPYAGAIAMQPLFAGQYSAAPTGGYGMPPPMYYPAMPQAPPGPHPAPGVATGYPAQPPTGQPPAYY